MLCDNVSNHSRGRDRPRRAGGRVGGRRRNFVFRAKPGVERGSCVGFSPHIAACLFSSLHVVSFSEDHLASLSLCLLPYPRINVDGRHVRRDWESRVTYLRPHLVFVSFFLFPDLSVGFFVMDGFQANIFPPCVVLFYKPRICLSLDCSQYIFDLSVSCRVTCSCKQGPTTCPLVCRFGSLGSVCL